MAPDNNGALCQPRTHGQAAAITSGHAAGCSHLYTPLTASQLPPDKSQLLIASPPHGSILSYILLSAGWKTAVITMWREPCPPPPLPSHFGVQISFQQKSFPRLQFLPPNQAAVVSSDLGRGRMDARLLLVQDLLPIWTSQTGSHTAPAWHLPLGIYYFIIVLPQLAPMPPPRVPPAPHPNSNHRVGRVRFIPGEFPGAGSWRSPELPPSLPQLKISSPSPKALRPPPPDILGPGFARNLQAPSPSRCAEVSRRRGACAGLGAPGVAAQGRDAAAGLELVEPREGQRLGLADARTTQLSLREDQYHISASCLARLPQPSRLRGVASGGSGGLHALHHSAVSPLPYTSLPVIYTPAPYADPSCCPTAPLEPSSHSGVPVGFTPLQRESSAHSLPLSRPCWHTPALRAPTGEPPGQRSCPGQ